MQNFDLNYALNDSAKRETFDQYFNTIASKELAFTNLNLAYFNEGFFLKVPKNIVIEKPIHVFYISQNQKKTYSTTQETFDSRRRRKSRSD
jgi:Fe-S cluster assembly protein SufD